MKPFHANRSRRAGAVPEAFQPARRRRMLGLAAATALGTAPVLALAAPAFAATGVARVGNTIVVNATANRANNITVTRIGAFLFVRDTGDTPAAGPGCARIAATVVRCSAAGV